MAALSLQGRADRSSFIADFAGSNRFIFDYLVEEVAGENVRGWQVRETEDGQRIAVTLLKETMGQETLTVRMARYSAVGQHAESRFPAPVVA